MAGTVCVACKLPNGLKLRLFGMREVEVPVMGGGMRVVKEAFERSDVEPVVLKGFAYPHGMAPSAPIVEGCALTHGVDEDFWNEWVAQNQGSDLLRNKIVFASPKPVFVEGQAKEVAKMKSGLEPLHRDGSGELDDERRPRAINPLITDIRTAGRTVD